MRRIIRILFSLPFDIFLMSLLFMWLMPFGTFDYLEIGFYLSILQAILTAVTTRFLLKKYQKDYLGKIK